MQQKAFYVDEIADGTASVQSPPLLHFLTVKFALVLHPLSPRSMSSFDRLIDAHYVVHLRHKMYRKWMSDQTTLVVLLSIALHRWTCIWILHDSFIHRNYIKIVFFKQSSKKYQNQPKIESNMEINAKTLHFIEKNTTIN